MSMARQSVDGQPVDDMAPTRKNIATLEGKPQATVPASVNAQLAALSGQSAGPVAALRAERRAAKHGYLTSGTVSPCCSCCQHRYMQNTCGGHKSATKDVRNYHEVSLLAHEHMVDVRRLCGCTLAAL